MTKGPEYRRSYEPPPGAIQRAQHDQEQLEQEIGRQRARTDRAVVALEADGETVCRSCGVALIWALRPGAQAVPLNREPDPEGTVTTNQHDEWVFGVERQIPGQQSLLGEPEPRYRLHFETCPDRDRWHRWGLARRNQQEAGDR